MPDLGPIVCKGYQQTTKVVTSGEKKDLRTNLIDARTKRGFKLMVMKPKTNYNLPDAQEIRTSK